MGTIKKSRPRGRPRRFDPGKAVETAQRLFHAHGYDGVSVADVTDALGINPPSFYAAFGSKAGLYSRIIDCYGDTGAVPLAELLRADRPVTDCLAAVLEEAARRYAADSEAAGCMVLEGTRCNDPEARAVAREAQAAAEDTVRRYVAVRCPKEADRLTDYVSTVMAGLSAASRNGYGMDRLLAVARLAGAALPRV